MWTWSTAGGMIFEKWDRPDLLDLGGRGWWQYTAFTPPMGALEWLNFKIGELHRDF